MVDGARKTGDCRRSTARPRHLPRLLQCNNAALWHFWWCSYVRADRCGVVTIKPQDDELRVRPTVTAAIIPMEYFHISPVPGAFQFICMDMFGMAIVISRAAWQACRAWWTNTFRPNGVVPDDRNRNSRSELLRGASVIRNTCQTGNTRHDLNYQHRSRPGQGKRIPAEQSKADAAGRFVRRTGGFLCTSGLICIENPIFLTWRRFVYRKP